jgi:hypothetical protein
MKKVTRTRLDDLTPAATLASLDDTLLAQVAGGTSYAFGTAAYTQIWNQYDVDAPSYDDSHTIE